MVKASQSSTKMMSTSSPRATSATRLPQIQSPSETSENGQQTTLVAVEDHVFPRWSFKRIITIGDAAHKVHPISAQGGNGAMETAAVLVNNLLLKLKCVPGEKGLSESDVENIFAKTQETRFASAVAAMEQGRQTTAASIKDTFTSRIFVDWFFPYFGQSLIMHLIVKKYRERQNDRRSAHTQAVYRCDSKSYGNAGWQGEQKMEACVAGISMPGLDLSLHQVDLHAAIHFTVASNVNT